MYNIFILVPLPVNRI